jgi:hypothetical protein
MKRHKQHLLDATKAADDSGGNSKQAGSSSMVRVMATTGYDKHQAWPPIDHFEMILEETCLNNTYPVKHKLKFCGMMKNFMALWSLTQSMEVDEVPNEGDATPFPREDMVMAI